VNPSLYCHHCQKSYSVAPEDLWRVQKFDPEHMTVSGTLYSYSGGCFFKVNAQLKRIENNDNRRKKVRS